MRYRSACDPVKLAAMLLTLSGCQSEARAPLPGAEEMPAEQDESSVEDSRLPAFCARPASDTVQDVFCVDSPPAIDSLRALQGHLGIALGRPQEVGQLGPVPVTTVNVAVFLGHSTALSGRLVSPINPRAILLGPGNIIAFQRGVQQVELASYDRETRAYNFYLVSFRQACNERPSGCTPGDLYTPDVESDWTAFQLRDAEELKNTPQDCRQCHQRGSERPALLMRELEAPWTHFFSLDPERPPDHPYPEVTGGDLGRDYLRAKGDEPFAELPVGMIQGTTGLLLEFTVGRPQPLLFDGDTIHNERWPYNEGWPAAPSRSATWDRAYEAFKRGEHMPLPHYEPRPTDPDKQAHLTEAYIRYRAGELAAEDLPDLAQIFPDDPVFRAELGLETDPAATPAGALIQACGTCHSDVLDQSISRARFSIDLSRMDRSELERAIERLERPLEAPGAMPPPEGRQLSADARRALIAYLRGSERSSEDDALLARAAALSFAGSGASASGGL